MILDERCEFADALDLALAQGTQNVGDQIPLGVARDVGGVGDTSKLTVTIQVTEAFTSGGAATVVFQIVSDDVAAIATDGSQSVHARTKAFSIAELTDLGTEIHLDLPPEASAEPYETFLGVQAVVAVADLTAGAVNAFLNRDAGNNKAYSSPSQYL
jgi:hypothetical protein